MKKTDKIKNKYSNRSTVISNNSITINIFPLSEKSQSVELELVHSIVKTIERIICFRIVLVVLQWCPQELRADIIRLLISMLGGH